MSPREDTRTEGLRLPWSKRDRRVPRAILQPIQQFLQTESAGGIVLLVAAGAALLWANSPWRASYASVWETHLSIGVGTWSIAEDLRHWVNDLLMAVFFYVVGLEIKRELLVGELRDRRAAALPAIAAIGGMVVPAAVYLAITAGGPGSEGWGIPMATDIAFAVGVLSLFGKRIPRALLLFVLALAIVDDLGAILVIALFYSGDLDGAAIGTAIGLLGLIAVMVRLDIRAGPAFGLLAAAVWVATFASGIHPTIAGVALAFVTPSMPFQRPDAVRAEARRLAAMTEEADAPVPRERVGEWLQLASLTRQAVSPLARNEQILHGWSSFIVLPVFALANAGVNLGDALDAGIGRVGIGIAAGLVLGKPVGIALASWIAVRTGIGALPRGVRWGHIAGAGAVAGIGFTVALFINGLAFTDPGLASEGKLAVLAGSVVAAAIGVAFLAKIARR